MKKVILAGGTGFIGQILSEHFLKKGYEIIILSRTHKIDQERLKYVKWDGKTLGHWLKDIEDADILINLNGKSVNCRYTDKNKTLIYDTRIDATFVLNEAISKLKNPPSLWVNVTSATIYRHSNDKAMDEITGEIGTGFSVDVCKKWEHAFFNHESNIRKVALRTAIVLGKEGGALQPLLNLARIGFGGKQGNGDQYFSWIHEDDLVRGIDFITHNDHISGVVNAASPYPLTNRQVMRIIRQSLSISIGVPMPKWLLEIGARVINTETELILKSRYVIPQLLLRQGFKFHYPKFQDALRVLV